MSLHAFLKNNIVVKVEDCSEAEYRVQIKEYELIIDVSTLWITPEIGWIMEGNELVPVSQGLTPDEMDYMQQSMQRKFGLSILPVAVDKIGARNLKLAREGTPANVAALASQMSSIKLLLEGGALKTVRGLMNQIKPSHPAHADILDEVIAEITSFLQANGWE